jgi:Fic family protein
MLLARSEDSGERFYSMSGQISGERKRYYEVLQKVQHSTGDITEWLEWFLHCLKNAMLATENTTQRILQKAGFWKLHENTTINERQRTVLNKLFDGFDGKLQTSKWAKITKVSADTALRDIKDLIEKGILQETNEGGRNTSYEITDFKLE